MEPDLARHEASVLDHVQGLPIPTPRLIAFCPDDTVCGHPVLLMSHLEGHVELRPENLDSWLSQLAEALSAIHRLRKENLPWCYASTTRVEKLPVPSWSQHGERSMHSGRSTLLLPRIRDFSTIPSGILKYSWSSHFLSPDSIRRGSSSASVDRDSRSHLTAVMHTCSLS